MKGGASVEAAGKLVDQVVTDYRTAGLNDTDRAILDYASRLTTEPAAMGQQDVQSLRDQGLDDRAIHDLCAIVAYFAFANRIADGLGIELET